MRINLEKLILLIGQALKRRSQLAVRGPKIRRGEVPQSSSDFPAAWSRSAFSTRASSLPAFASCSNWRSHSLASNSANHRRNSTSSSVERAVTLRSSVASLLIPAGYHLYVLRLSPTQPHPSSCASTKSITARLNSSGYSAMNKCPPGNSTSFEPEMRSAIILEFCGATRRSSRPAITIVGTRI